MGRGGGSGTDGLGRLAQANDHRVQVRDIWTNLKQRKLRTASELSTRPRVKPIALSSHQYPFDTQLNNTCLAEVDPAPCTRGVPLTDTHPSHCVLAAAAAAVASAQAGAGAGGAGSSGRSVGASGSAAAGGVTEGLSPPAGGSAAAGGAGGSSASPPGRTAAVASAFVSWCASEIK